MAKDNTLEIQQILMDLCTNIQGGKWGVPTMEMLQFSGRIQGVLEKGFTCRA